MAQNTSEITIGIDLGDRVSAACVLGYEAQVLERSTFRTDREGLDRFLGSRPKCRVVIEAGGHSRWVTAELTRRGYEAVVANPRAVKLITQSRKKNDRRDAETLARLGRADVKLLSPIQHRSETAQRDLTRIQARDGLVRSRTQLINEVRGSAKAAGYRLPRCSAATFHNVAAKLPDDLRLALGLLIDAIAMLNGLIGKADKELREAAARHPDASRLKTVDRVGPITALAYVMILEDPARFAGHRREVGSFVGLAPRQHQSGDSDMQLRISKAGNPLLRRLLVNSAQQILGPFGKDSDLKRWGLELAKRGGKNGKKRAVVAVARKLAVILHKIWSTEGEVYRPFREPTEAAAA